MPATPSDPSVPLEQHLPYLRVLAELELGLSDPLRRRVDPSDVVQETLLKARLAVDKDPGRFAEISGDRRMAWLRKILVNTLANLRRDHRAARRDLRRERALQARVDESSVRLVSLAVSREPSPSQCAIREESVRQVATALLRLPPDQRRAVILQRLRGLPIATIAEDLGRSKDAVAGLIRRGLERLESELGETA